MEVRDNFIAVINPIFKSESAVFLTEEDKTDMIEKQIQKMEKLEVAEVGSQVTGIKKGDMIYINPIRILGFPRVTVDDQNYIFFRDNEVIFKY